MGIDLTAKMKIISVYMITVNNKKNDLPMTIQNLHLLTFRLHKTIMNQKLILWSYNKIK